MKEFAVEIAAILMILASSLLTLIIMPVYHLDDKMGLFVWLAIVLTFWAGVSTFKRQSWELCLTGAIIAAIIFIFFPASSVYAMMVGNEPMALPSALFLLLELVTCVPSAVITVIFIVRRKNEWIK